MFILLLLPLILESGDSLSTESYGQRWKVNGPNEYCKEIKTPKEKECKTKARKEFAYAISLT